MDFSVSILSQSGDEYRITLSPFENDIIPNEIKALFANKGYCIEIVEATLSSIKGKSYTGVEVLFKISNVIGEVFAENKNMILYFYCDDMHEIARRDKTITPQKFRSRLFSMMFERYIKSNNISDIVNIPIELKADRDIYIHLIARTEHLVIVDAIKNFITETTNK